MPKKVKKLVIKKPDSFSKFFSILILTQHIYLLFRKIENILNFFFLGTYNLYFKKPEKFSTKYRFV